MDTHNKRKEAAQNALARAVADRVQYEAIALALGGDIEATSLRALAGSLRGFASHGKLGPDKTIALLKYLTERGYVKQPQDSPRLVSPLEPVKDPWLVLGDKLMIAHDICVSPLYSDVDKLNELRKFIKDFNDYFAVHVAAVENYRRLP
jgi:hypothetical protein